MANGHHDMPQEPSLHFCGSLINLSLTLKFSRMVFPEREILICVMSWAVVCYISST